MMASNMRMANAMEASREANGDVVRKENKPFLQSTAKTMSKMNKVMNPEQMTKVTEQFTQEHMKMGITDEMSKKLVTCVLLRRNSI